MMRLACFFALISLVPLVLLLTRLDGATATVFSFVGFPTLGLALLLYAIARWRSGAFRATGR
ncbi:MAG: hypothetical protein ABI629_19410 [bacterium]